MRSIRGDSYLCIFPLYISSLPFTILTPIYISSPYPHSHVHILTLVESKTLLLWSKVTHHCVCNVMSIFEPIVTTVLQNITILHAHNVAMLLIMFNITYQIIYNYIAKRM